MTIPEKTPWVPYTPMAKVSKDKQSEITERPASAPRASSQGHIWVDATISSKVPASPLAKMSKSWHANEMMRIFKQVVKHEQVINKNFQFTPDTSIADEAKKLSKKEKGLEFQKAGSPVPSLEKALIHALEKAYISTNVDFSTKGLQRGGAKPTGTLKETQLNSDKLFILEQASTIADKILGKDAGKRDMTKSEFTRFKNDLTEVVSKAVLDSHKELKKWSKDPSTSEAIEAEAAKMRDTKIARQTERKEKLATFQATKIKDLKIYKEDVKDFEHSLMDSYIQEATASLAPGRLNYPDFTKKLLEEALKEVSVFQEQKPTAMSDKDMQRASHEHISSKPKQNSAIESLDPKKTASKTENFFNDLRRRTWG